MIAEPIPVDTYREWLRGPRAIRADGAVMSWFNPEHPGYPYPEIAGYMLSHLALEGRETSATRNRVATRLMRDLTPSGAVGRRGVEYVFDSAMVLAGLLAHEASGGLLPDPRMIDRVRDFIVSRLERRVGLEGEPEAHVLHWSQSYGCHLLKTVISLTAYDASRGADTRALVEQLLSELLPLYDGQRFHVNADSDVTYTHAHCYALEGLLVLEGRGRGGLRSFVDGGADWLARVQEEDGGVPAEHDSHGARMQAHTDCTAQAIRIWTCANPERFAENIERGVEFLRDLSSGGAMRYQVGSSDLNTWATIFGTQALDFAAEGGKWQSLI